MRTKRSMPSSTVIPVLGYPDVAQAVDWLCGTFGFAEHLRIGSHRSQLTVGDGSIVVAARPARPEIDSKKTKEGRGSHQGETNNSVMVRMPNVDRHFERAKKRGAKILQPPTDYPFGERQYTAEDLGVHTWTFPVHRRCRSGGMGRNRRDNAWITPRSTRPVRSGLNRFPGLLSPRRPSLS